MVGLMTVAKPNQRAQPLSISLPHNQKCLKLRYRTLHFRADIYGSEKHVLEGHSAPTYRKVN